MATHNVTGRSRPPVDHSSYSRPPVDRSPTQKQPRQTAPPYDADGIRAMAVLGPRLRQMFAALFYMAKRGIQRGIRRT